MAATTPSAPHRTASLAHAPGVVAWLRLARAYQKLERSAADHLRAYNLSVAQFDILAHIGAAPGLTQDEISRARLTTKGNLSQLLDRMEHDSLIRREREGRTKRVYLSPAGERLFERAVPSHETFMARQFGCIGAEDAAALRRTLRLIDRSLP